jgi:hypothetical protein
MSDISNEANSGWHLYKEADTILHSRIQTYALSQTFYLVSFVTILASISDGSVKFTVYPKFGFSSFMPNGLKLSVCIFLIIIAGLSSVLQQKKMQSIHERMRFYRRDKSLIGSLFIEGINSRPASTNPFIYVIPTATFAFWIVCFFLIVFSVM